MADERHYCNTANCSAAGDDIPANTQLDTVVADWGDFAGDSYSRLIYIDADNDDNWLTGSSISVKIAGNIIGRGILIVTGDLVITGTVQWEGLIYVMDQIEVQGNVTVRGGIISKDVAVLRGSVNVIYD